MSIKNVTLKEWERKPLLTLFKAYPDLTTIWRPELTDLASKATEAWELNTGESGQIYTIEVEDDRSHITGWRQVPGVGRIDHKSGLAGVTGWYRMTSDEAGLRWHGILPEKRLLGIASKALELVCGCLPNQVRTLYEVTNSNSSKDFFLKCGFEVVTDTETIIRAERHAEYNVGRTGWILQKKLR